MLAGGEPAIFPKPESNQRAADPPGSRFADDPLVQLQHDLGNTGKLRLVEQLALGALDINDQQRRPELLNHVAQRLAGYLDRDGFRVALDDGRGKNMLGAIEGDPPRGGPDGAHVQGGLDAIQGIGLPNAGLEIRVGLEGEDSARAEPFGAVR